MMSARNIKKKIILILLVIVAVAVIGGAVAIGYIFFWPMQPCEKVVDFKIEWGTPLIRIAQNLEKDEIVRDADTFLLAVNLLKKTTAFKAGLFQLHKNSSNYLVIKKLTTGSQRFIKLTIPEGITSRRIASIVQKKMGLDSTRFVSLISDSSFIRQLGIDAPTLEGYLFPETYYLTYGVNEKQVITAMVKQFKKAFSDSLMQRVRESGFTLNEVLTLASIIQGEAILDSEMVYISSVYHNRLRQGIPLQADPTIQYLIPDGPRRLLNKDLAIDSPYNTYKYPGLPPGPINNPGINAIIAALYPANTKYLYFVANGKGGHIFSETLRQHLNAKRKFDEIRRQVARERRRKS